jgi:hypothetical protein
MQIEHALRDVNKPIDVAGWVTKLVESLPRVEGVEAGLSPGRGKQGKANLKGVGYGG